MSVNATPKQISYALALLHRNGYDTRYMNASFKELGATMKDRSGTVEYWLGQMTKGDKRPYRPLEGERLRAPRPMSASTAAALRYNWAPQ